MKAKLIKRIEGILDEGFKRCIQSSNRYSLNDLATALADFILGSVKEEEIEKVIKKLNFTYYPKTLAEAFRQ